MKKDFEITKSTKIVIISITILFMMFLFYLFSRSFYGLKTADIILNNDLNKNFQGKVDSLYFDERNHNVKIAVLSNGYKFEIFRLWEPNIQKGDSLLKLKGSLLIEIYKKNQEKIILNYKTTYKSE